MKNHETDFPSQEQENKDIKKPFLQRHKNATVTVCLILIIISIFNPYRKKHDRDKFQEKNDAVILDAAARSLNKQDLDLTEADYLQVNKLYISNRELFDVKLLDKFVNLKELSLFRVRILQNDIPEWKAILVKCGIYDLSKDNIIDLSALKKLDGLENLSIVDTPVNNIMPLAGLTNLQRLNLDGTMISDLNPVRNLVNLYDLCIANTLISSLEPVRGLDKLEILDISNTPISDLGPVKELKNLQVLYLENCKKITSQQVEGLYKDMPNLIIVR
jgi:Leucine-rich repeat (LRR) protein